MATYLHFYFLFLSIPIFAKSDTYIVHMDLSLMPKAFSSPHNWYLATTQSIFTNKFSIAAAKNTLSPPSSELLYSYTNAIHGFSATLTQSELEILKSTPGYLASFLDSLVEPDTTRTPEFLGLSSNSGIWPVSSYGKDVIIGVVDSGVWPESKSFNDVGLTKIPARWKGKCESGTAFNASLCNKKLIGARIFNKGLLANNPGLNISINSVRDTNGHGTHCASTAAGNYADGATFFGLATGVARGVAPHARLAIYKALWDEGAFMSDVVAAIDSAITDGVDVISMSLGREDRNLYENPYAIATYAAMAKGIFVSLSAGNRGPDIFTVHNANPWVLTVAAGSIDREFSGTVNLADGNSIPGEIIHIGNSSSLHQIPIIFMKLCEDLDELNRIGYKIVVCQDRVDIPWIDLQYSTVSNSKVAGAIFITDRIVYKQNFMYSSIPSIFVDLKKGEIIKNYIKKSSNAPKASMNWGNTLVGIKPAPMVAEYSSRGPFSTVRHILKPDLMAPGSLVLAAWPKNVRINPGLPLMGDFNLIYGTSMACPHAAGVAALLKAAHPTWSPAAVRSAMMTTADSTDNTNSPIVDLGDEKNIATPIAMGAGHINPNKALHPGLIYDMRSDDYVKLLCGMNFTAKQIRIIARKSHICSNSTLDVNYPSFIGYFNDTSVNSTVRKFERTVTNVGDAMSTYIAKVTQIRDFFIVVVPEKLVFRRKNEKLGFKVTIKGPRIVKKRVDFGYLKWVETKGKYEVKSPVVVYGYGG